jgi:V/A-type H+-transporting ATPase subunit C
MATRLLSEEELASLVSQPPETCAGILEHAGLSRLVADLESGRYLEQSIIAAQLADILILMRAAGAARSFLQYWALRFEMANLKAIIRGRMSGAAAADIRGELSGMGFLTRLPIDELLQTEDIGELLRRLEATPYGDMVRFARRAFEAQPRLFDLDAALDRRFYHGLAEQAYALEDKLGPPFRRIIEAHIDRVNLTWLLRFRFVYQLPPAQVYYLLIPSRYRLSSGALKELTTLNRFEEVLAALPEPYRSWLRGVEGINQAAAVLDREFARTASSVLHSAAPAFARAFAYLMLRDRNLRRVRAVLKGHSLGLEAATVAEAAGLDASMLEAA